MQTIEDLKRELDGATQAAHAAPQGVNEWPLVNELQAKLNAAIEAAKTDEQRQIEALQAQIGLLERKANRLDASLQGAISDCKALRHIIGLHTGKPTDKPIGMLAMHLEMIRGKEDELAKAVRAGDLERAQRICINRGLPRSPAATLSEELERIGLTRRQA